MQKISSAALVLLAFVLPLLGSGPADAALQAVGPINAVTTLPEWYQDANGLTLGPCVDQNGFCVLTPEFDPAVTPPGSLLTVLDGAPPISDNNWPNEAFYFLADSTMNVGPTLAEKAVLRIALEAAFLNPTPPIVVPGQGITFLRINLKKMSGLTPGNYTVTHPYGSFPFTVDATGNTVLGQAGQAFRTEDPVAPIAGIYFPIDLQNATTTNVGPFLVSAGGLVTDPLTGNKYIGNPAVTTSVSGSPTGNNVFRIDGPDIGGVGVNTIETPFFNLSGKIVGLQVAAPAGGNDFGPWQLNATVPAKTYTVTNLTGPSATVSPLLNSNTTSFSILNDSCTNAVLTAVSPGNTCTFDVLFTPVADGATNSVITINTDSATATVDITGTGDSIAPTVTVNVPAFTNLANLTITGTVADNTTVGGVEVSLNGGAAAPATVTNGNWSFNLTGLTTNASNSISVTASDTSQPTANVSAPQLASITHDSINPAVTVASPLGIVDLASPPLDFTATDANGTVSTVVTLDGQDLPSVPATLGPLVNGSHNVKVDVTDPAGNIGTSTSSFTVNHAAAMAVSPLSALFGNVATNITSSPKAITITNNGNSGFPLTINSLALSGIDPTQFQVSNGTCGALPAIVPIGSSCNFLLSFAPNSVGTKLADLTVAVTAVDEPSVSLTLEGVSVSTTNTAVRRSLPTLINYASLLEAFTAATGSATLQAMDTILPGGGSVPAVVVVDSTGTVNFSGGFDALYASKSGVTQLLGALMVRNGALVVDGLTIQ